MTRTQPVRETSTLLGSVTPYDVALRTPQHLRPDIVHATCRESEARKLRVPARAHIGFRLKTLFAAGALVLFAHLAALLFG